MKPPSSASGSTVCKATTEANPQSKSRTAPSAARCPILSAVIVNSAATICGNHSASAAARLGRANPASSPTIRQARAWREASLRICSMMDHPLAGPLRRFSGNHVATSGNQISTKTMKTMIANIGSAALVI